MYEIADDSSIDRCCYCFNSWCYFVVKIISSKIIDSLWSHFPERKTQITMEGGNFYRVGPGFRRGAYHISRGLKITRSLENLVTEDRGK